MKEGKKRKGFKIFGITVLILIILLIVIVGGTYWYIQDKLSKLQRIDLKEEELRVSTQAEASLVDYRNIAIFGVDSRDDNLHRGNRSDCIIIASLNNKTKEVKLISVYRDTYVQIEGHGLEKITHAYSYGSAPLAIRTLNTNLDLNIKEFITVNFDSVAGAVDKLGGVVIEIETEEELKYLNSYIDGTAKVTGKSNEKVQAIGKQTLNGVQAVAYSRIRYTEGGDYKRTERMRTVIEAMVEKLKTKNISEINSFIDFILPKVYTNITAGDVFSLLPNMTNFKITNSIGWPYETKGITLDRWYGVPVTLERNVIELHKQVFQKNDYQVSQRVKEISEEIAQKTGYNN
ncbi:MAG: LytR family transcriptional regulator [Clostridia bacterium]|nr:LytR family transcriptional regulator [Clostridia bacterium]